MRVERGGREGECKFWGQVLVRQLDQPWVSCTHGYKRDPGIQAFYRFSLGTREFQKLP